MLTEDSCGKKFTEILFLCHQVRILEQLEGVHFGAGPLFLVSRLLVDGDVKLNSVFRVPGLFLTF